MISAAANASKTQISLYAKDNKTHVREQPLYTSLNLGRQVGHSTAIMEHCENWSGDVTVICLVQICSNHSTVDH